MSLKFEKKNHRYSVDGVTYRSVTELVGSYFPEFNSKAVAKKLSKIPKFKAEKKGVRYWLKQWKMQQEYGSLIHDLLDKHIKSGLKLEDDLMPQDEYILACQWIEQEYGKYNHVIFSSEYKIHSDFYKVAGTCDLLINYEVNGNWLTDIIDWKVTKEISKTNKYDKSINKLGFPNANFWKYSLQLNMYAYLLMKHSIIKRMRIVHLTKEGVNVHEVPVLVDKIGVILDEVKNEE